MSVTIAFDTFVNKDNTSSHYTHIYILSNVCSIESIPWPINKAYITELNQLKNSSKNYTKRFLKTIYKKVVKLQTNQIMK